MAGDQRYCLECGARRGGPRVDYRRYLEEPPALAPSAPATVALRERRPAWTLATALATIACLLLAMGVGVMIGRAGDGDAGRVQAAAPPQVIRVNATAPAATTTATTPAATTPAATRHKAATKKATARRATAKADAARTKATNEAVQQLDSAAPDEYQKQSQKLPKELGTGGKAPPKDDKPAAGGGGFETIG